MTAPRRRWTLLVVALVVVLLLVGGRWLALETAERAWAATLPPGGAAAYLLAREVARLVSAVVLLFAVSWGVLNVYVVYRSIGSVQMPRRLGDLEILEAVPHRVLLAITVAVGLLFGLGLTWGTGDWWRLAALAAAPPRFGITDPILHKDLGYYLGQLPWADERQGFVLLASVAALGLAALLYAGIGSLRIAHGRPVASPHARVHLAVLLACVAAAIAWGAWLDPAEVVAGMHGALDRGALAIRIPGASVVGALAAASGLASLIWGWRTRPALLAGAWATLLLAMAGAYLLLPAIARGGGAEITPLADARARYERLAFGAERVESRAPPEFADLRQAVAMLPLWGTKDVAAVVRQGRRLGARASVAGIALTVPAGTRPLRRWLIAPAPDDTSLMQLQPQPSWDEVHRGSAAHAGPPLQALEGDTDLVIDSVPGAPAATWFGPGFGQYAVVDSTVAANWRIAGVPLVGEWRRLALAWTLQSPELTRTVTPPAALLWRRDVTERLARLAPFADFDEATPVLTGSDLWWIAYGNVEGNAFPLARPLRWHDRTIAYRRAGLLGGVNAASGETRLWYAPGVDSLTTAWARVFAPPALVQPTESIPPGIRSQLPYPDGEFRLAAAALERLGRDTAGWSPRPTDPFVIAAPSPSDQAFTLWTAQGFESLGGSRFEALLAGTETSGGPRLFLWRTGPTVHSPQPVAAGADRRLGVLRLWPHGGSLFSAQAQLAQTDDSGRLAGILQVYLSLGERQGVGRTAQAALENLTTTEAADTSLPGRLRAAQNLIATADSALARGDLEDFAKIYRRLSALLHRQLAPAPRPD